ncbi:MAG: metallo-mystery pair system four-Cys motif protein [Phycisphaerae bacterium]
MAIALVSLSTGCLEGNGDDNGGNMDGDNTGEPRQVTLNFAAKVRNDDAVCGTMYSEMGTTQETVEVLDLRFYISNVRLRNAANEEVAIELDQDGVWQLEDVALLDFEDGTGGCSDTGTSDTNTQVTGTVPDGEYDAILFDVAVPFDLNHDDVAASASPLNVSAMYWAWAIGHKFIRVDIESDQGVRWNMHVGSTMCASDGPMDPPVSECSRPNRPAIELDGFDPDTGTIVFDLAELFSDSDLSTDTENTASGCQTFPDDVNECTTLFPNLGLDFESGECVDGCAGQSVFRVE